VVVLEVVVSVPLIRPESVRVPFVRDTVEFVILVTLDRVTTPVVFTRGTSIEDALWLRFKRGAESTVEQASKADTANVVKWTMSKNKWRETSTAQKAGTKES